MEICDKETIDRFWDYVVEHDDSVMVGYDGEGILTILINFDGSAIKDFAEVFMDCEDYYKITLCDNSLIIPVNTIFYGIDMDFMWKCRPDGLNNEW